MFTDKIIDGKTSHREALKTLLGEPVGYSMGRAAKILQTSRQGVTAAIERDALHATRIYMQTPQGRKLVSTEVDRDSVHALARSKTGRQRAPRGYIDDQLGLFT